MTSPPPNERAQISRAHLATGRAVDQLRRQLGIVFKKNDGTTVGACPLEGITTEQLEKLATLSGAKFSLLLTGARARYLKLDCGTETTVCADVTGWNLSQMNALADPLAEGNFPNITLIPPCAEHETLIALVKHATLLPAVLLVEHKDLPENWLAVDMNDIAQYWNAPPLDMVQVTQASLPIKSAEHTRIICFRSRYGTSTHLALLIGKPEEETAPLVRVHSSCITGDILGSLRCDCGDQLQMALSQISNAGSGILLYLHQEGRGIGIANKIRAYALQEKGIDTFDANLMLGYEEDERDFKLAATMLEQLNISSICLMTNNPAKIDILQQHGINVKERVKLAADCSAHNKAYLEAKIKKSGHLF